ncbi:hypothetical protein J40TS1_50920 [Paenibacillus montaniterrae]|uniref:Uncharacterized protein n=1 Tax=Paenibacillus montaniterrae TaxID=429341 RepID=A0A919YU00_9BACL|nr:hypothetical protein [Paenibacillus montaniterrae]GIP19450.1 hypothetical protein J40TS1_50920 [Paenibacillus montaniterrae]
MWIIPLSVSAVLLGLMLTLFIAERAESRFGSFFVSMNRKKLQAKSDSLDMSA